MPPVLRPYLVCASQRSGSTLVCETLRATGVAGNPLEHFQYFRHTGRSPQPADWFEGLDDPTILELLKPAKDPVPRGLTPQHYRDRILAEGTTPNGVWSGKLMWNQVPLFLDHLEGLPNRSGSDLRSAVRDLVGEEPVYVHVQRPDVVPQAVSMWRAVQTQQWRGDGTEAGDDGAVYHFGAIRHLAALLEWQKRGWQEWFAAEGIEPLLITFDDLKADARGAIARVLTAIGLPDVEVPEIATHRQGNSRSKEWVTRYREDLEASR